MKLQFSLFLLAGLASGQACLDTFDVTGACNYDTVAAAASCDLVAALNVTDEAAASDYVTSVCDAAVAANTRDFTYVTYEGTVSNNLQFDNNYFDGGTEWNDAKETDTYKLKTGDAGSILRTYNDYASDSIIGWPDYGPESYYTDNFKNCDLRIAMCCFTGNRYDTIPLVPNSDVCHHDLHDSKTSNHVTYGYAVYDTREEKAYCNAFSWDDDANAVSARYAGNALFYISMYSGLYENGLVENIPGSPMCACIEQMATVSDTDCTKVDAAETYSFTLDSSVLSATLSTDVTYSECGTSFIEHYTAMADAEEVAEVNSEHIVSECGEANEYFMNTKYYVPGTRSTFGVDLTTWEIVVGKGYMYSPPISESELRASVAAGSLIMRKCLWCDASHKEIYYKRLTAIPPPEELDFLDLFMNNWYSTPANMLGVDFNLYSTYEDAVAGTSPWTFCNYDDESVGFPRDCGPTGRVNHNWNSYVKSNWRADHHAFYVEKEFVSST